MPIYQQDICLGACVEKHCYCPSWVWGLGLGVGLGVGLATGLGLSRGHEPVAHKGAHDAPSFGEGTGGAHGPQANGSLWMPPSRGVNFCGNLSMEK